MFDNSFLLRIIRFKVITYRVVCDYWLHTELAFTNKCNERQRGKGGKSAHASLGDSEERKSREYGFQGQQAFRVRS